MAAKNNRMILIDEDNLVELFYKIGFTKVAIAFNYKDEELEFPNLDDLNTLNMEEKFTEIRKYLEIKSQVSEYEKLIKPFIVNNEE